MSTYIMYAIYVYLVLNNLIYTIVISIIYCVTLLYYSRPQNWLMRTSQE